MPHHSFVCVCVCVVSIHLMSSRVCDASDKTVCFISRHVTRVGRQETIQDAFFCHDIFLYFVRLLVHVHFVHTNWALLFILLYAIYILHILLNYCSYEVYIYCMLPIILLLASGA